MFRTFAALSSALIVSSALAQTPDTKPGKWMQAALDGKPLYAVIATNQGDIAVRFFSKDAPKTVANFVGLAMGEKPFTNPKTGKVEKGPFYKNVTFHRVIPDFMIQGGDPEGSGRGGPGYKFEDEFQSGRGFDKVGLLAMANAGPGTNGSQFFITTSMPTYLNNRHTIFGEVVKGYDVVQKISAVEKNGSTPVKPVVMTSVTVSDKAPKGVSAPPADAPTKEAK